MTSAELGELLLRVAVGAAMVPHGFAKVAGWRRGPPDDEVAAFERSGLKPARPWIGVVGMAQVLLGSLLVLGLFTTAAALAQAVLLLLIVLRWPGKRTWFAQRGGFEYPVVWAIASVCVALLPRA